MIGLREPLTASVVGGGVGGRLSLKALAASDRYRLVAATDLRPEVLSGLARDYPGLRTFTDSQDMFAACPIDAGCVSTYAPHPRADHARRSGVITPRSPG